MVKFAGKAMDPARIPDVCFLRRGRFHKRGYLLVSSLLGLVGIGMLGLDQQGRSGAQGPRGPSWTPGESVGSKGIIWGKFP